MPLVSREDEDEEDEVDEEYCKIEAAIIVAQCVDKSVFHFFWKWDLSSTAV